MPPNQLRGVHVIWLMFQACNMRDLDLKAHIINFLSLIYQSISRLLLNQKTEIYEQFTEESLTKLQAVLADNTIDQAVKNDFVSNTMMMLKTSFQDTEKSGTACLRPHCAIDRPPKLIEQILVSSYIPTTGCPKHIMLSVDASMTLWELIDLVARRLDRSPLKIQLKRGDNKKPELTAYRHCQSLAELGFEKNEEVTVMRNMMH